MSIIKKINQDSLIYENDLQKKFKHLQSKNKEDLNYLDDLGSLVVEYCNSNSGDIFNLQILKVKECNQIAEDMLIPNCKKQDKNYLNKFLNENIQFKWNFNYE